MHFYNSRFGLAAGLCLIASLPCAAAPGKFGITLIRIDGNSDFDAASVNGSGTIVGTLFGSGGTQTPMEISGNTATALPSPGDPFGTFYPTAINDAGDVLGYASDSSFGLTDMFLLQGGSFNIAYAQPVVEPGNATGVPPLHMSLTNNLKVSFNDLISISGPIVIKYGRPPHFHSVTQEGLNAQVFGVSGAGMIAGTDYLANNVRTVFTGTEKALIMITPPNAKSVSGGYINDANTVAGSFEDNAGASHGFTYAGGKVTVFDMAEANSGVGVTAINSGGRVVGVYADTSGEQHGFLWNGSTAYSFGKYRAGDSVAVAIGNRGDIVVSDHYHNGYRSERVICRGTGC